jgi:transglutaminase-like putative cysteine protease
MTSAGPGFRYVIVLLICLLIRSPALAQCEIKITDFYTSDRKGNRITPQLGDEEYCLHVNWTVAGQPSGPYKVKFELADSESIFLITDVTRSGSYSANAGFKMPLGGELPCSVTVDSEDQTGNTSKDQAFAEGTFTPVPPDKPIEFYDAKSWSARQTVTLDVPFDGVVQKAHVYFGQPITDSFQEVLVDPGAPGMITMRVPPFDYPALFGEFAPLHPGAATYEHSFTVKSYNVRADLANAMARWSQYKSLPAEIEAYLKPEEGIPCDDPAVLEFVAGALPSTYRQRMSPYKAAKALFLAVARNLTSAPSNPSIDFWQPAGAVAALKSRKGDAGTFSSLYVACLRSIGIPARTMQGWVSGQDTWDGLCEIYVPKAGWLPQDVMKCYECRRGLKKPSNFAYYFDTISDLNTRVVVSRGNTFATEDGARTSLQTSYHLTWSSDGKPLKRTVHCSLTPLP